MEWISVKDRPPEVPKGKHAVSVIAAQFDEAYEEINPGKGYSVHEIPFNGEYFMDLFSEGEYMPVSDPVTHWMPMPKTPDKMKHKATRNEAIEFINTQLGHDHETENKHGRHHYGKLDLLDLMDFIYGKCVFSSKKIISPRICRSEILQREGFYKAQAVKDKEIIYGKGYKPFDRSTS